MLIKRLIALLVTAAAVQSIPFPANEQAPGAVAGPAGVGAAEDDAVDVAGFKRFRTVKEHLRDGDKLNRSSAPNYNGNDNHQRLTEEDIKALRERGVTHVITVNSKAKDPNIDGPLSEAGIAYTSVKVEDFQSPTAKDFKYIYEEFKKHDRNAHIWCGYGDVRSGTVVSAIQMFTQKEFPGNPEMLSEDVWIKVWARNKVEKSIQMEALGMLFDDFHPPSGSRGNTVAIIRKINPFYTVSDARKNKYTDALPKSVENISFCKRASKCTDLADMAEKLSERRFAQLAGEHGVARVAQEKWSMTLSDVRKKFGYQKLTGESIKLKLPSLSKLGKSLGKGLLDPLWVVDVVHAFTTDASTIDRWEAVTSILPFVGCGWEARADAKKATPTCSTPSLALPPMPCYSPPFGPSASSYRWREP